MQTPGPAGRHGCRPHDRQPGLGRVPSHHVAAGGRPAARHERPYAPAGASTRRYDPVEDRIKAGQFGGLKRDGEYYSAVFDSLYARELEKLGFGIDRQGGKKWEIAGITAIDDRQVLQAERTRSRTRRGRLGITDPEPQGGAGGEDAGARSRRS